MILIMVNFFENGTHFCEGRFDYLLIKDQNE
jgi:hypothetical protein